MFADRQRLFVAVSRFGVLAAVLIAALAAVLAAVLAGRAYAQQPSHSAPAVAASTGAATAARGIAAPMARGIGGPSAAVRGHATTLAVRGIAAVPTPAPAAPPAWVADTADELTRLQDRTLVLQAQLKELQAQQAVDAQQHKPGDSPPPTLTNVRVVGIERFGGRRYATVRVDGGGEFDIVPGDMLSDGAKVDRIDSDTVVVRERGGQLVRLRVGAGQASGATTLGNIGAPAVGARE